MALQYLTAALAVLCTGALVVPSAAAATAREAVEQTTRNAFHSNVDHRRFSAARAEIQKVMREQGVASIAVAVAKDGKIIWQDGFGWADRERRVPATAHTPYGIGSITKPMTATAIMALHEQGKIDLNAAIDTYIRPLKITPRAGDPAQATVRRVMSHTAGLPLHYYYYVDGRVPPPAEETISRYAALVYPPGDRYFYSNIGYRVLDYAVTRASGDKFENFLRTSIFLPLGMNRTSVGVDPAWAAEAAALYTSKQELIPYYRTDTPGGSDVYASAHDLLRFGMFHLGTLLPDQREVVSTASRTVMQTVATPPEAVDSYGLGWFVDSDRGFRRVSHTGKMPGSETLLYLYPDHRVAIVVLANQTEPAIGTIAERIAAAVLPGGYAEKLRAEGQQVGDTSNEVVLADVASRSRPLPNLSGKWTGTLTTYARTVPLMLDFQPDGDVHFKVGNSFTTLLNGITNFGGQLLARSFGPMPVEEARRHRHSLLLLLQPHNGELIGQLNGQTLGDPDIFSLAGFVRMRPDNVPAPARQ